MFAEAVEISRPTVERLRRRAALEGAEAALHDRPRWEIVAWERDRNAIPTGVNWRFTTADAGIKLKRLYPSNQP